jgi:heme A synthase
VKDAYIKNKALWLLALIVFQIGVGISNVLLMAPPLITVLHLAVGTALLGVCISLYRRVTL